MPNLVASWTAVRDSMKIHREKPRVFDRHEIYVVWIALCVRVEFKKIFDAQHKNKQKQKNMALRCIFWEVACKLEQKCRDALIGMSCSIKNQHCYLDLMISVL